MLNSQFTTPAFWECGSLLYPERLLQWAAAFLLATAPSITSRKVPRILYSA